MTVTKTSKNPCIRICEKPRISIIVAKALIQQCRQPYNIHGPLAWIPRRKLLPLDLWTVSISQWRRLGELHATSHHGACRFKPSETEMVKPKHFGFLLSSRHSRATRISQPSSILPKPFSDLLTSLTSTNRTSVNLTPSPDVAPPTASSLSPKYS